MQPSCFNDRFSVYKFFRNLLDAEFATRTFWNRVKLPQEEAAMQTLDHYLILDFSRQALNRLQVLDMSLYLFSFPAFDPTTLWIQDTPDHINQFALQKKTGPDWNQIQMYDYDQVFGDAAITAYRKTGAFPANFLTVLAQEYPDVPYYEPRGQRIGLKIIEATTAKVETLTVPYQATWRISFEYFEPKKFEGAVTFG